MNKRKTIGVVIGNANSPYTIEFLSGISEAAKQEEINIISFVGMHSSFLYKDYFIDENQEDYDYQSSCVFDYDKLCDIDALIISYGTMSVFLNERELADFQRKIVGIPTVFLEKKEEGPKSRYIVNDNYNGIKLIMDHMINFHGYRDIVYLSGPLGNFDADERLAGYKASMEGAGLECGEEKIAYGDFSEGISEQLNDLLDRNPDAEAIVCANDTMAIAAYEVIAERAVLYEKAVKISDKEGIKRYKKHIIGASSEFGIAITGYDNIYDSANVDPPLTTVVQSPYSYGYMAINVALGLLENPDKTESIMASPKFVNRQSCGCKTGKHMEFPVLDERYALDPELYATTVAEIFTTGILPSELNKTISDKVYEGIYELILKNIKCYLGISGKKLSAWEMLEDTKKFLSIPQSEYIQKTTFVSVFTDFMLSIIKNSKNSHDTDALIDAESRISDYIYSKLCSEVREELIMYRHRAWFMPLISRDMANNLDSIKDMYKNAMVKLKVLDIGDAYIFIMDEAVRHRRIDKWECPKELRLVASTVDGVVSAYDMNEAPVISKDNLINNYIGKDGKSSSVFMLNLYSGEEQYGIIVARTLPRDILSLYCASIQMSTAIKYCDMARIQRSTQTELQRIIQEVEDKNEILRSLSEYDHLTSCYNRRGFLEKGLDLIRENVGNEVCILFADLDHLKEINDRYGHTEGDYAIENIANNIRIALPDSAIIARLGGDEFVAMFVLSEGLEPDVFVKNISNMSVAFNAQSDKPFYVECSVGQHTFTCTENTSLEEVMAKADGFLYEAKARRRQTIVKKITIL